jgi:hypothetical protein
MTTFEGRQVEPSTVAYAQQPSVKQGAKHCVTNGASVQILLLSVGVMLTSWSVLVASKLPAAQPIQPMKTSLLPLEYN